VKGQKKEEGKPIEIEGVEEWEIEKILNKRKIRGIDKYLVRWKEFTAEHDTWERKEDLGNAREVLEEFEERMNAEVRRQEKLDMEEEKDFRRGELPGKFMAKMLYGWDDGRFEEVRKELAEMESSFSGGETLKGGNVKNMNDELHFSFFIFILFTFLLHFSSIFYF